MNKKQLINAIAKLQAKTTFGANRKHLATRTIEQLRETYSRMVGIESVTDAEIRRHCNVSFIR